MNNYKEKKTTLSWLQFLYLPSDLGSRHRTRRPGILTSPPKLYKFLVLIVFFRCVVALYKRERQLGNFWKTYVIKMCWNVFWWEEQARYLLPVHNLHHSDVIWISWRHGFFESLTLNAACNDCLFSKLFWNYVIFNLRHSIELVFIICSFKL